MMLVGTAVGEDASQQVWWPTPEEVCRPATGLQPKSPLVEFLGV